MNRYFSDIVWPTVLTIAIVVPVLITYMPYIPTGGYDIATSITQTLSSSLSNPFRLASTYLLGDLAPYLYAIIIIYVITRRGRLTGLGKYLGFSWKPILGLLTVPLVLTLMVVWFLISGLLPLIIIPLAPLPEVLTLIYTLYPIAISEEVVFRGFILNRLLPRYYNASTLITTVPAIIVSALYFTLAHVPVYLAVYGIKNPLPLLTTLTYIFIYGVISGFIYVITNSVVPDIIMHWINDYLSMESITYPAIPLPAHIIIPIF
ncbi:MAG: CPBP family intramembrane metalloprotease [Vulcanisaeta sp.]|nr:CPBP family intramembrane metalloprotease [Vulcanisaeta sp.]